MDSKKLLVISDTHGSVNVLKAVFKWAAERMPPKDSICAAAFLGDGIEDINPAMDAAGFSCNWVIIKGNNDFYVKEAESAVFDFVNYRFLICHGHRYSLYGGYHALVTAAKANDANVVLSGHTHIPHQKIVDGIYLINPGSVGRPRSRIGSTFAVIECEEGKQLNVEFFGIDMKGKIQAVKI